MATVTIDIPGIGTVEAENAASESTLRELVNLMKSGSGGGSGGGGRRGGSGGGSGGGPTNEEVSNVQKRRQAVFQAYGVLGDTFKKLGNAGVDLVGKFANAGDSLESAAGVFSDIPVVGSMFGLVASSATKVADSFAAGAASGATFDGSIRSMSRSASQAGMTLDQFGGFLASNGAAMVALGGETSAGAKRFTMLSSQIRDSGQELFALGFSTQTINEGFANYAKQLRLQGLSQKMTDQELVQGSKDYLKEMDALAKITGEERKAKEAERERLLADAQFQASMAGLSEEVRNGFLGIVQQMPSDELGNFAKDILATGTATTAENQFLMSMMQGSAAILTEMNAKMQRGEAITTAERARLNDMLAQEGPKALESAKFALAADQTRASGTQALASTLKLQQGAFEQTMASQEKARASQEALNERVNEARASIAGMSNEFLMGVSESGALPQLMQAFELAGNLVLDYILPAFQFLGDNINTVIGMFILFKVATGFLSAVTGTLALMKTMEVASVGALLVAMAPVAAVVAAVAAGFLVIVGAVYGLYKGFQYLKENGWSLSSAFEAMGDTLKSIGLKILDIYLMVYEKIFGFFGKGDSITRAREAVKEKQEELKIKENARDQERAKIAAQRKADKEKEKEDNKSISFKKQETKSLETANKKLDKERQKNVDYNTTDTIGLLGQELKAQQSSLASAESTKKDIETERAQEKAKATEAKEESKPDSTKASEVSAETSGGGSDQKSATELLASLNTKLDALIRVSGAQLQVQRGLSGDLFA